MTISSETTLHRRILSDIERRIVSGDWPPGFRLPFELDLAQQYGCSRMTVNKVMTQLVQTGLIERRKKSGSFVTQPRAQSAVLEIHDIREEIESLGLPYRFSLVSKVQRAANDADKRRLGLSGSACVVDITCVHFAGEQPFCLEERLINLKAVPEARNFGFETMAPGPWLLSRVPWTTAEHRIQAISASRKERKILNLAPQQACLVIERRTWSSRRPVTFVRLTYPGNRHVVTAQFKPGTT